MLISVPLALAAFDIPSEAMNLKLENLRVPITRKSPAKAAPGPDQPSDSKPLPIFMTPKIREQFLEPVRLPGLPALESLQEDYFRLHVPYGSIIFREARKNGLAPELVAAMVHTESDFRATLVSHKSAQGLMQIVPETAKLLGIENPFDPDQNIAAGTKYFRYLLDRFNDENVALAAYNAGEGNVERFGGVPPFPETQSYIAKVNRRTHRYRHRVHSNYLAAVAETMGSTR